MNSYFDQLVIDNSCREFDSFELEYNFLIGKY